MIQKFEVIIRNILSGIKKFSFQDFPYFHGTYYEETGNIKRKQTNKGGEFVYKGFHIFLFS